MPSLPLPRSQALAVAALLIGALVLGGRLLLRAEPAREAPPRAAAPLAAPAAARLVVHVVGAVRRPGLYRLDDGSRIADALSRAGGATAKADLELVNLAAPLADGQQVVVPRSVPASRDAPGASAAPGGAAGPVHLNTASVEQLDALPGVGPVTAQKILDYRTQHGAFSSIEELDAIPGIGPARLDELRGLVAP